MKLAALTGLSRESIEDLLKHHIRTFEIRSAHNMIVFSGIRPGDSIFITDVVPPDLIPGVCGHIVTVRGVDVHMSRVSVSTPLNHEERETMGARVQLVVHAIGKVRDVYPIEPYKPIYVEAIEIKHCDAR
ncbi:MAG: hypothetical protein A4E28_00230 [Methanocella sp. PtaU1.Bin125]|nr:MAG: hypothetical protein A4E28_00230 [Methanocella sp. PtaU1.Bin125]